MPIRGCLVPAAGLEPALCRQNWILSPTRLPFHHAGEEQYDYIKLTDDCQELLTTFFESFYFLLFHYLLFLLFMLD